MTPPSAPSPTRSLNLSGATNFRDLGGYVGLDGRPTLWRRLFRSDHLGQLQADDIHTLQQLGLRRVLDLRGDLERETAPCAAPGLQVHSLAIEPTVFARLREAKARHDRGEPGLSAELAVAMMQETYRDFIRVNTPRFREFFDHLLADTSPVVFHCTAGKDRTGVAAALLLRALGVSAEDVLHDYLLTNTLLKTAHAQTMAQASLLPPEALQVLNRVQPDFLRASLDTIDTDYGGFDAYLRDGLGLGPARQRALANTYLEG